AALAAALGGPEHLIASSTRRPDLDIGRLGPVPFDEARHLPSPDRGSLFVVSEGHGPAFLFVHGLGVTSRIWTKQFAMLPPAGLRAVAFDHRGHGASTAPPSGAAGTAAGGPLPHGRRAGGAGPGLRRGRVARHPL